MQAILFIGLQASGKSTFYKERFYNTHLRISMDLLNKRNKEKKLMNCALSMQQRVVIDNTNPSKEDRKRYFDVFKARKYKMIAYFFESDLKVCLERNRLREGKARIPDVGLRATFKKLEMPEFEEGFDLIYKVRFGEDGFVVEEVAGK